MGCLTMLMFYTEQSLLMELQRLQEFQIIQFDLVQFFVYCL